MLELTLLNIAQLPLEFGIYRIFVGSPNGEPIKISRFCGNDPTGLLYIGRTTKQNLNKRLYQFYASAHPDRTTHNHSGAQKYYKNAMIRNHLGNNHSLYFDIEITDKPQNREKELLNTYFLQFGEYPPLNK